MQKLNKQQIDSLTLNYASFSNDILKKELRPYQLAPARNIIESVLQKEAKTYTMLFCRQSGKTETLSTLAVWLASTFPGIQIGYYAPTFRQAIEITMRRIKSYLALNYFDGAFEINRGNMVVFKPVPNASGPFSNNVGGSLIGASSADISSRIEGATWDLLLLDETQELERRVIDVSLMPMLTATQGTLVMAGTPFNIDCGFYDTIQAIENKKLPGKNYVINHEIVSKFYPEYKTIVDRAIAKNGADSLSFQTQYSVKWVGGLGMFFEHSRFDAMGDKTRSLTYYPQQGKIYVAGLDVGGSSQGNNSDLDSTVLTISEIGKEGNIHLTAIYQWTGDNSVTRNSDILQLLKLWNPVGLALDTTGMGQPVGDIIELSGVVPYTFKVPFTPHTKSAIGFNAESAYKTNKLSWPAGEKSETITELINEAKWLIRDISPTSKRMAWYVDEMHGHDDMMSSWFLGIWAEKLLRAEGLMYSDLVLPSAMIRSAKEFSHTHFGEDKWD